MKKSRIILISLLVSMAVYFTLTWPLAPTFHEGIPSSNRPEQGGARYMIPGDHLQFLFQLWMLADSFTGKTPLFYHVYEFNQGDDKALYNPGSYYFPFGLVYSAGYAVGGRVVGWNLMLCLTVWLIYLSTWLLLRRFTTSWLTAGVAALPSILLPYFYVSLLGGSPTGMGMLWVPLIFLGVDVAIRDRKLWGGVLAGILLFIASWVDLHVFFFVFLATPVWALMCVAFNSPVWTNPLRASRASVQDSSLTVCEENLNRSTQRPRRVLPLLPVLLGMIGAYLQTSIIKSSLDHTLQSQGRSVKESMGYALRWPGWFDRTLDNPFNLVYIGIVVAAVIAIGLAFLAYDAWRKKPRAGVTLALFVMVGVVIAGIAILALGPNTPFDTEHRLWQLLRTLIPPYKMIRQPAKIYCLLAPFLGVALAMAIDRINQLSARRVWAVLLAGVITVGCMVDYGRRLDPTLCLLDYEQGAYRAVAEDSARSGRDNRAMAVPLWPGDSHWNSITEYYATLHRTKMLNGYSPSVSRQYFTNVFERFEAVNMGVVSDDILDGLLAMKVGYLILHEDAFPQKVSPFPVSQTLFALQGHPRLQFLAHDKAVWSFKIIEHSPPPNNHSPITNNHSPIPIAWQWDACDMAKGAAVVRQEASGANLRSQISDLKSESVNVFMRLSAPDGRIELDARTLYPVEGLRYVVSVRGEGLLRGGCQSGLPGDRFEVPVSSPDAWTWVELPVPVMPAHRQTMLAPAFTVATGTVDVSMITLVAGPWKWLKPGERLALPATAFSGTGYSDPEHDEIHLDRDRVQADAAFYVSVLPVLPGRYRVTLDYSTPAPAGTVLGEWTIRQSDGRNSVTIPVSAGKDNATEYQLTAPRPLSMSFRYNRKADMVIRSVALTRVE